MTPPPRRPLDWSDPHSALMAHLWGLGDPEADAVVSAFDESRGPAVDLWRATAEQVKGEPTAVDASIDAYLRATPWPGWADDDLILAGQDFFQRNIWALNVAFFLGSLPMSYCARDGALVLARTGRFHEDAQRRIFETALLVMEVGEAEGLCPGGAGYLTLRRLRLLHAAVRRTLLHHRFDHRVPDGAGAPWIEADRGYPVSQLDLLGTLWAFALTSVEVLRDAGRTVTPEEEAAWVHLWCVAGHLLGVVEDTPWGPLLPMTPDEASACFEAVKGHQFDSTDAGIQLTASLVAVGHACLPGRRYDGLAEGLIRAHVGEENADRLGLAPGVDDEVLHRARSIWRLLPESAPPPPSRRDRRRRRSVRRWLLGRVAHRLTHRREVPHSLRTGEARDQLLRDYLGATGRWARRRGRAARVLRLPP